MNRLLTFIFIVLLSLNLSAKILTGITEKVDDFFQDQVGLRVSLNNIWYYNNNKLNFNRMAASKISQLNLEYAKQSQRGFNLSAQFLLNLYAKSNSENSSNIHLAYNIKEFYHTSKWGSYEIALGRKLHTWSEGDDLWRQGFWQPRFNWNRIDNQTVGLTGAFFKTKILSTELTLFASPIYIPESGPEWKLEDGKFISRNPWFRAPADTINLGGSPTKVIYKVNIPSMAKLIFQPSFGLSALYKNNGFFTRLSLAQKPMNQIINKVQIKLRVDSRPTVKADIIPRAFQHQIATLEFGVKNPRGFDAWFSHSFQRNLLDTIAPDVAGVIAQRIPASTQASTFFIGKNFQNQFRKNVKIYLSHTLISGGYSRDFGELSSSSRISNFGPLYDYFNTSQVGFMQNSLSLWSIPSESHFSLLYDFKQKISALQILTSLKWRRNIFLSLRTVFFGRHGKENEASSPQGLLRKSFSNDYVSVGVQYVF